MRCAPALLKVSTVHLAPSSERPAATQSALPSTGATKPSSETDILRTSGAMGCFLPVKRDLRVRWRGGELQRGAEPAGGAGGEGEGPVVGLGDALDDRQAQAGTCVLGAYAFGSATKRVAERRHQLCGELLAGVLDSERHAAGVNAGRDPHGALVGHIVDDRVVHEIRTHLQQERVRADGGG